MAYSTQQLIDIGKNGPLSTSQAVSVAENMPKTSPVSILSSVSGGNTIEKNLSQLSDITQPKTIDPIKYGTVVNFNNPTGAQYLDSRGNPTDKKNAEWDASTGKQLTQSDRAQAQGGITSDELHQMFGNDVNLADLGLNYDQFTGTYIPTQGGQAKAKIDAMRTAQNSVQVANNQIDSESQWILSQMKSAINGVDPMLADQIKNIQADYENRKAQLQDFNTRSLQQLQTTGMRYGTSRYSQETNAGLISSEERAGIQKLNELAVQTQGLVVKAQQAAQAQKWDMLNSYMTQIEKQREQQTKETEKLLTAKLAQEKTIAEKQQATKDAYIKSVKDDAIASLFNQGITDVSQMLNTLNYDESGNKIGDFTAKEISDTLGLLAKKETKGDLTALTGETRNYFALKQMGALPGEVAKLPEDQQLSGFLKFMQKGTKTATAQATGMGAEIPSFDQFSKEQIALSVIPTQLRNSDAELKRYQEGIRSGLKAGKTPYDIADQLMGYSVNKPDAFSNGLRQYFSVANLSGSEIPEIARLVNAGAYDKAISVIENNIYQKAKTNIGSEYISEAAAQYSAKKTQEIAQLVLKLGDQSPVGVVKGTMQQYLGKLKGNNAQEVQSKITSLVSNMKKDLLGSAVTESEKAFLEPLIPALNDSPDNFMKKLSELRDNPLTRLNTMRAQYELPQLTRPELLDRKLRVPLYSLNADVTNAVNDPLEINTTQSSANDPMGIL